jgi:hypothetical protein
MGKDDFWVGVGAGAVGVGLVLYGTWNLHNASYERGLKGEELQSQGFLGIFGWTTSGALVLMSSFNKGKYDREVKLSLTTQASQVSSINNWARHVVEQLNRLEQESKVLPKTELSVEEKKFVKDLHDIAKTRTVEHQTSSRQSRSYVA